MSSGKVSVVIPVYNVEKYLPQCLDSVLNQTYRNLEIICTDDCSPDHSAEILRNYAQRDKRVIVLRNECNLGLAATRNRGVEVATGEFIYFLDSDDWISHETLEKCVVAFQNSDVDFVAFGLNKFYDQSHTSEPSDVPSNKFSLVSPPFKWGQFSKIGVTAWTKVFRKQYLIDNEIRFLAGILYEDNFFTWMCLACCRKIALIPERLYYYRIRPGSIMHSSKERSLHNNYDFIKGLQFYYVYLQRKDLWAQEKIHFMAAVDSILVRVLHKHLNQNDAQVFCDEFRKIAAQWDWKPRRFTIAYDILYSRKIAPFAFYRIVRSLRKRMGQL